MTEEKRIAQKENDELDKKDTGLVITAIVALIIIIGFWLFTYFKLKDLGQTDRGTFGDMFGSVNALFSGLAFAGIILTILLQRKELGLQRQELKDTRQELKRSADAQENSEAALKRQAENLKISAKLTALNTLVIYYADLEKSEISTMTLGHSEARSKRTDYLRQIELILQRKDES